MKMVLSILLLLVSFSATAADTKDELIAKLKTFSVAANGCALYIEIHNGLTDSDCFTALHMEPEFEDTMDALKKLNLADELTRAELMGVLHSGHNAKRSMRKVRSHIRIIGNQQ